MPDYHAIVFLAGGREVAFPLRAERRRDAVAALAASVAEATALDARLQLGVDDDAVVVHPGRVLGVRVTGIVKR